MVPISPRRCFDKRHAIQEGRNFLSDGGVQQLLNREGDDFMAFAAPSVEGRWQKYQNNGAHREEDVRSIVCRQHCKAFVSFVSSLTTIRRHFSEERRDGLGSNEAVHSRLVGSKIALLSS